MATNKSMIELLEIGTKLIDELETNTESIDELKAINKLLKAHLIAQRKQGGQYWKDIYRYNKMKKEYERKWDNKQK